MGGITILNKIKNGFDVKFNMLICFTIFFIVIFNINNRENYETLVINDNTEEILLNINVYENEKIDYNKDGISNLVQNENSTSLININTASLEELDTLTGIGEVIANNIIEYREEFGFFSSIEEIVFVSKIGEKTFEKIKEYICV